MAIYAIAPTNRAVARLAFALAAGTLAFNFIYFLLSPGPLERIAAGAMLGTVFGQSTLLAILATIGPIRSSQKAVLVISWLVATLAAAIVGSMHNGSQIAENLILLGGSAMLQFALCQIPLRAAVWWSGISMQLGTEPDVSLGVPARQYGIRQLMLLTAAVAVALGVGRIAVLTIDWAGVLPDGVFREGPVFGFIVLVNTLAMLPLGLGVLLRERAHIASLAGLSLIVAATFVEAPVAGVLIDGAAPDLELLFFVVNLVQAGWIAAALLKFRCIGYRIVTVPRDSRMHASSRATGRVA